MKTIRGVLVLAAVVAGLAVAGCGGRKREITDLQRREASAWMSEAQFAISIRDYPRAEGLLVRAVEAVPDTGAYWVSLGFVRVKQGNRSGARDAYKFALGAYEVEAKVNQTDSAPWLKQIHVLALLGRIDDAKVLLEKTAKRFSEDRFVRQFVDGRQLDFMLADPKFKEAAL